MACRKLCLSCTRHLPQSRARSLCWFSLWFRLQCHRNDSQWRWRFIFIFTYVQSMFSWQSGCLTQRSEGQAVLVNRCAPHLWFIHERGHARRKTDFTSRIFLMWGQICNASTVLPRMRKVKQTSHDVTSRRAFCLLTDSSKSSATKAVHSMATISPLPTWGLDGELLLEATTAQRTFMTRSMLRMASLRGRLVMGGMIRGS